MIVLMNLHIGTKHTNLLLKLILNFPNLVKQKIRKWNTADSGR